MTLCHSAQRDLFVDLLIADTVEPHGAQRFGRDHDVAVEQKVAAIADIAGAALCCCVWILSADRRRNWIRGQVLQIDRNLTGTRLAGAQAGVENDESFGPASAFNAKASGEFAAKAPSGGAKAPFVLGHAYQNGQPGAAADGCTTPAHKLQPCRRTVL